MQRNYWSAVICGGIILTIGIGARQSFGIFQKPIAADLQVGRELWSFCNALALLLMGFLSPFAGNIAERFGSARTIAGGGVLYVLGIVVIGLSQSAAPLIIGNALTGIGMAAAGFGPILGVVGRAAPPVKRSLALGIATAGGSFGQFAIVPFASISLDLLGNWHNTMLLLAAVSVIMVPLALGLRETRASLNAAAGAHKITSGAALREARDTPSFWLLTIGFFVCGFHVAFVGLHLPSYIADKGVDLNLFGSHISPIALGGWAIGMVGLFNIAGAVLWGWSGGRYQRKNMLALLYFLRAMVFLLFIILPLSGTSVLIFAATLGFLWLGTIPLTSGLVGHIFGPAHMSMLYGVVFFGHQLGSFLGSWGGGKLFDLTGNYDAMWWISVALGLITSAMHLAIREQPVPRLAGLAAA
ncbi:MAG: MFS transporter [Rhodospirillales bacterium]